MPKTLRVLMLEDSQDDAELVAYELRKGGLTFDWRRVETEEDYLAQLEWSPDVILADYNLPYASAASALRILKAHGLNIPFLVVSGAIGEEIAVDMIRQGASDYLLKDRLTRLPSAVTHALRESELYQQKQEAEEKARRNDARLRKFMENAPFGFCRLDFESDRFLTANSALIKMLVYGSESELLVLPFLQDVHTDERTLEELRRAATFSGVETKWKRKDGTLITVLLSGCTIRENDHELVETIVADVTQQRALEEQLRESQKMEAIGRLAGGVAHDFNNLLQVIIAECELLSSNLGVDHPVNHRVEQIQRTGFHAARLVSQLLAFSRKQMLQPQVLDLNLIVSEASTMLRRIIREDIELCTVLCADLGTIKADPTQIMQVLINLVTNARDAMPCGGTLKIETRNVKLEPDRRPYSLLEIMDTGMGMDENTKAHVF